MTKNVRLSLYGLCIAIVYILTLGFFANQNNIAYNTFRSNKNIEENIDNSYIEELKYYQPPVQIEPSYLYQEMGMKITSSTKTYMDYRAITSKSSAQYKIIHSDRITICDDGFLRDTDGFIGVAMGSYFGNVGERYICHLDNGKTIKVIKVEEKADQHTVGGFYGSSSKDIVEFVIDTKADWMQNNKWNNGYIFSGNFNNYSEFKGKIVRIEKVQEI